MILIYAVVKKLKGGQQIINFMFMNFQFWFNIGLFHIFFCIAWRKKIIITLNNLIFFVYRMFYEA